MGKNGGVAEEPAGAGPQWNGSTGIPPLVSSDPYYFEIPGKFISVA
jgi:hypothetical protein